MPVLIVIVQFVKDIRKVKGKICSKRGILDDHGDIFIVLLFYLTFIKSKLMLMKTITIGGLFVDCKSRFIALTMKFSQVLERFRQRLEQLLHEQCNHFVLFTSIIERENLFNGIVLSISLFDEQTSIFKTKTCFFFVVEYLNKKLGVNTHSVLSSSGSIFASFVSSSSSSLDDDSSWFVDACEMKHNNTTTTINRVGFVRIIFMVIFYLIL